MAIPGVSRAQDPHASSGPADTKAALVAVEEQWVAALVRADTASLDRILAPTFIDGDEEGHRADKRFVLHALASGDLKMTSIQLSDMHAYRYGNAAVVNGLSAQKGAYRGKPAAPTIVFTDTFVLRGGEWHPVASQRTTVPTGH